MRKGYQGYLGVAGSGRAAYSERPRDGEGPAEGQVSGSLDYCREGCGRGSQDSRTASLLIPLHVLSM